MENQNKVKRKIDKFRLGLWIFFILVIITLGVWQSVLLGGNKTLQVSVLNIGQGDSIYIKAPNGNEMIIDGGPDQKLLSELGSVMPFFDKSVDVIVVTNPDKDHYAGFIDMLDRYSVGKLIESGTISSTPTYHAFEEKVKEKGIERIIAQRGMKVVLDEKREVYLEILFPNRDVSSESSNDGSIVAKLVYGNTCMMLQGDSTAAVEQEVLIKENKESLKCELLKVGHHGSRTSSLPEYIKAVSSETAIISLGKDNRYGHPHKEVLETLENQNIKILRTDIEGRITFVSDGKNWERK
ncbi:MAG TPA: MBL fold metallo-hydrolase [Candidatus Paceibacterota bacterium]|nr:MBL fold metallo-hydrolase [Candidatus Paceibacterota bacterium]